MLGSQGSGRENGHAIGGGPRGCPGCRFAVPLRRASPRAEGQWCGSTGRAAAKPQAAERARAVQAAPNPTLVHLQRPCLPAFPLPPWRLCGMWVEAILCWPSLGCACWRLSCPPGHPYPRAPNRPAGRAPTSCQHARGRTRGRAGVKGGGQVGGAGEAGRAGGRGGGRSRARVRSGGWAGRGGGRSRVRRGSRGWKKQGARGVEGVGR